MKKVQVVVINKKKEVLLLQTVRGRGSFWQNVTGAVASKETFYDAAKRELAEETGIETGPITLRSFFCYFRGGKFFVERIFLAVVDSVAVRTSSEHGAFKWKHFSVVTEDDYEYYSNYKAFLKGLKKYDLVFGSIGQ
jgi:8-oxo-dGTP pyrophosphatase MutT (NUDIX family)